MPKPKLQCSFSGGRTSAYMSIMLKRHFSDAYDIRFMFANTGSEHPDTLRFVNEIDIRYGLGVVWLEAVVHSGERKASTHRIVSYETASRRNEPFDAVCAKYGIPNQTFKLCTRELKLNPMNSYMDSIGWKDQIVAIGIRMDETRRVSASATAQRIVYPLVHWFPTDKQDVLAFFEDFAWDLGIPEHQGNCVFCYKKSDRKLHTLYREDPKNFDFPIRIDSLYKNVGPNNVPGPRQMFRGRRDVHALLAEFRRNDFDASKGIADGGCSESCEVYDVEEAAR